MKKQEQSHLNQGKGDLKKYSQPSIFQLGNAVKLTLGGPIGSAIDSVGSFRR